MTGTSLPEDDHVIRYVKPSLIDRDAVDGGAFLLRENETGLSVNWLEAFTGDKSFQISQVKKHFSLTLKETGRFAELTVGKAKRHVSKQSNPSIEIGIVHAPLGDKGDIDPSHSEIIGLPPVHSHEARLIGDLIAECVNYPLHRVM